MQMASRWQPGCEGQGGMGRRDGVQDFGLREDRTGMGTAGQYPPGELGSAACGGRGAGQAWSRQVEGEGKTSPLKTARGGLERE